MWQTHTRLPSALNNSTLCFVAQTTRNVPICRFLISFSGLRDPRLWKFMFQSTISPNGAQRGKIVVEGKTPPQDQTADWSYSSPEQNPELAPVCLHVVWAKSSRELKALFWSTCCFSNLPHLTVLKETCWDPLLWVPLLSCERRAATTKQWRHLACLSSSKSFSERQPRIKSVLLRVSIAGDKSSLGGLQSETGDFHSRICTFRRNPVSQGCFFLCADQNNSSTSCKNKVSVCDRSHSRTTRTASTFFATISVSKVGVHLIWGVKFLLCVYGKTIGFWLKSWGRLVWGCEFCCVSVVKNNGFLAQKLGCALYRVWVLLCLLKNQHLSHTRHKGRQSNWSESPCGGHCQCCHCGQHQAPPPQAS